MCMVMASGVNLGACNDATAIKMTAQQLQPRTSSVSVTSVTGNHNKTVTLQVLLPSQLVFHWRLLPPVVGYSRHSK